MRSAIFLLFLLFGSAPAAAEFLDCSKPEMVKIVKERLPNFKCAQIQKNAPAGLPVRYIWDASDKTFAPNLPPVYQTIQIANDTVAKAEAVWSAAATLQMHEVTFVLGSTNTPIEFHGKHFKGLTMSPRNSNGNQDCIVLLDLNQVWLTSAGIDRPRDLAFVIAHEFAHCVQRWNYPYAFASKNKDWWLEGLATTLGQVVVPDAAEPHEVEQAFVGKIGTVPFTQLSYENGLLFQWMWNKKPASVFEFMVGLNEGVGLPIDAQAAEFVSTAGGAQGMSDFARKLVDNGIPNGAGWRPGPLKPGLPITISEAGSSALPGAPYTVQLRPVIFKSGRFAATLEAPSANVGRGVKMAAKTTWANDFPLSVGSDDCDQVDRSQVVVMKTDKSATASIEVERKSKCKQIGLISNTSAGTCPVGTWDVDNNARAALLSNWLGRDGKVTSASGTMRFNFRPDGTSTIDATDFAADIAGAAEHGMPPLNVHVAVTGSDGGKFTASAGLLSYKNGGGTLKVNILVKVAGMSFPAPSTEPFNDGQWKYECEGDVLQLTYVGPIAVPPSHVPKFTLLRATHW
ncbi:hypothetical protein SPAN111604_15085 [Sphingomonas antarctica]|uniref:hypothetical protein n=1 Tax=Sphingomonas antarctica TaxID=2040274 RepID=UPI0039EA0F21